MKSKNLSNKILKTIKSRGFNFIELPPVIEANHILQRSGENFRKYLFSFNNSEGKEFANSLPSELLKENKYFLKFSPDLWRIWLASITGGNSIKLNPLDLIVLRILLDKFFDFIYKIVSLNCRLIIITLFC